jgi:predicted rRNA methylase YqxC with S4 and FtsJ domains
MESSPKGSPRRLDTLLVERGLAASRSSAQGLILSGSVRVGDVVVTKAGSCIGADEPLSVDQAERFVSRAGEKLDAALGEFGVLVEGRSCLDAGASTGGFTDALLQREAILLVKPQFEAGPESVGRGGLVKDREVHAAVISNVAGYFASLGFGAVSATRGAVAGRKSGNLEYPVQFLKGAETTLDEARIREVVGGE